jgi:transposase, IS5 family
MRRKIQQQPGLLSTWIDHHHARELEVISGFLERTPALLDLVHGDLAREGTNCEVGREALTADSVLRALIVKQMGGFSYSGLAFALTDSASYRSFCGLGLGSSVPSRSALHRNIKLLRPDTLEAINRLLIKSAERLGVEAGRKVRVDTTVTESHIRTPSDSGLLWDCVRVLTRLMWRAKFLAPVSFQDQRRRAKRRWLEIACSRTDADRLKPYTDLFAITKRTMRFARKCIAVLECLIAAGGRPARKALRLVQKLTHYLLQGVSVLKQTRRRVFLEQSVPSSEKLVSIFEPHSAIIVKDRRETQYGHKVTLTAGRSGMVLDCVVEAGNPPDSTLATSMIQRQLEIYGRPPRQVAMDGGFTSRHNLASIKAMGVKDVAFSKARSLSITEMAKNSAVYRRLRRFRAGIEGTISFLKRTFGMKRCDWRGLESFKAYVWSSVVTANLVIFARHSLR